LGAGEPELGRRPQAEHLVAARGRLELELLVDRELFLETFLALVERGHACLAVSGAAGADARSHPVSRLRLRAPRPQRCLRFPLRRSRNTSSAAARAALPCGGRSTRQPRRRCFARRPCEEQTFLTRLCCRA